MKKVSAAIAALGILTAVIWAAVAFTQPDKPYFPPKPEGTDLEFWLVCLGILAYSCQNTSRDSGV